MQAPVLVANPPITLDWTWDGSEPAYWQIQSSEDGLTEWEPEGTVDGFEITWDGAVESFFYRIRGASAIFNPVTAWSNVVQI